VPILHSNAVVAAQVQKIRADVRAERQAGKLIVYASTPISPRGGGTSATNLAVAASVKTRLEKEYGAAVWVPRSRTVPRWRR
jgi:hypothetical protein